MSSDFTSPRQRQVNERGAMLRLQSRSAGRSTPESDTERNQKSRMVSFRVAEDDFIRLDALALHGKTHGIGTGATPLVTVGDSRRSIDTSAGFSAPYRCRTETENAFHNNWHSAKPSNPGPSDESSQFNGRRFRGRRTLAVGVISFPTAPRTATPVRFDFCSDESGSEVRTTLREAVSDYGRSFEALGRVDITS